MRLTTLQQHTRHAILGMLMGMVLSFIGFTNYDELHKMFLFADLRLFLTFAGAVLFAAFTFNFLVQGLPAETKIWHPGVIPGAILFGSGWAMSGSCPSIALIQIGEGQLAAVFTALGMLFGVWLYREVHRRFFRWDSGSCS
jgi:uncharacterized membrane protein YedE/YeeE